MIRKILLAFILLVYSFTQSHSQGTDNTLLKRGKQQAALCKKFDSADAADSLTKHAKIGLTIAHQLNNDSLSGIFNNYLAEAFQDLSKIDSAIKYYRLSLKYALKIHNDDLILMNHMGLGNMYEYKGTSDSVYTYVLIIEKEIKKIKNDDLREVATSMLGNIYSDHNQYENAIKYYLITIRYNKKINNGKRVGIALSNIGNTYLQMSKTEKALPYFKEAITYFNNFKLGQIVVNDNIGASYTSLKMPDSAIIYHRRAIAIAKATKDTDNLYAAYEKLSDALIAKKRYAEAEKYLTEALSYALKTKEATEVIDGYTFFGELEQARKNYGKASGYFKQALNYAISTKHTEREDEIYKSLAESLADDHRYDEAYNYEVKYKSMSDSLSKESAKNSIVELESQYQSENKQQKINLLTQEDKATTLELQAQKRTKYFLIAGLFFVVIIVVLMIRGYRIKQKANQIFAEKNTELESKNTELKVVNDKLDEANQSKTKLFSILSHDLRAPIGSVFQFINLQKNHPSKLNEEESKKHNERILNSAENLMGTMEDILIWSKSQMDSFSLNMTRLNACELIDQVIELHQDFAEERQIRLKRECSADLLISSDENFLKIVLRNIVSNGIKFSPPGGNILITADKQGDAIKFKIHDNGVGMTQDQIANLFEWNSIRSDSSGLGLKLAREFITRLGGTIEVNSAIQKGTTFIISVPQESFVNR
jgi:signal transduction histidine kinase